MTKAKTWGLLSLALFFAFGFCGLCHVQAMPVQTEALAQKQAQKQALLTAIKQNNVAKVKSLLLEEKVDPNISDGTLYLGAEYLNRSALWQAAKQGNLKIAKLLISAGARLNDSEVIRDSSRLPGLGRQERRAWPYYSPLYVACYLGHTKMVSLLLEAGASYDAPHYSNTFRLSTTRPTALHVAASVGAYKVVKLLLQHGADATKALSLARHHEDGYSYSMGHDVGFTALHLAARDAQRTADTLKVVKTIKTLLQYSHIDVNIKIKTPTQAHDYYKDFDGHTALHMASSARVAKVLLQHGADIRATSPKGDTPLHSLLEWPHYTIKTRSHVFLWPPWYPTTYYGSNKDDLQVEQTFYKLIKFLIATEPELIHVQGYSGTPFFTALDNAGHLPQDVLQLLMDSGSDVTAARHPEASALHIYLYQTESRFSLSFVKGLIRMGVDVNALDWRGLRPLHFAATYGHIDLIKLLVKHGARVDLRDDAGLTPCEAALNNGHKKAAELLS